MVYQPDHNAHIRHRLKLQAAYFATGGAVVILSWTVLQIMIDVGEVNRPLATVASWLVRTALAVATLGLVVTLLSYLIYRRRRADPDVAGTEASREVRVRLHYRDR